MVEYGNFSDENVCCSAHWNCLYEKKIPLSTHNIRFYGKIEKYQYFLVKKYLNKSYAYSLIMLKFFTYNLQMTFWNSFPTFPLK